MKAKVLIGLGVLVLTLASCGIKLYDEEVYNAIVQDGFVVDNIDALQDWATIRTLDAVVTLDGNNSDSYTVGIYLENPAETPKPTLLYEEKIPANGILMASFAYPIRNTTLYVGVFDETNYGTIQAASVTNDKLIARVNVNTATSSARIAKPATTAFAWRYCFESDFPDMGDCDFNDVVMTLTPTLDDRTLTLRVRLDAVGTQKQCAAAIRLVGVGRSDLAEDPYVAGENFRRAHRYSDKNIDVQGNIEDTPAYLNARESPNKSDDMVLLLFQDAHYAMSSELTYSGYPLRYYYNTVTPDDSYEYYRSDLPCPEVIYIFKFNDANKAKQMLCNSQYDAFIIEAYNGVLYEVHTVQNGFATNGTNNILVKNPQVKSDNYPWAIVIPATASYPHEWHPIGGRAKGATKDYSAAYPLFTGWARNRNSNHNWYEYPSPKAVY